MRQLIAMILFITSVLWSLGTAGALDNGSISEGQAIVQLSIGIAGLTISAVLINFKGKGEVHSEQ